MSTNGVGGENFRQQGKMLDLKKLDKLVGKEISKYGALAKYDKANNGGNENNIFDQAEIDNIKRNYNSQPYNPDGSANSDIDNLQAVLAQIEQEEVQKPVTPEPPQAGNGDTKNATNISGSNPLADLTMVESEPTAVSPDEKERTKPTTNYTIQPGDTPEKLAEKLGLEGEEAQQFIQHMKDQMAGRKWFNVGEKVTLLGDQKQKIEDLKAKGDYTENHSELTTRFNNTEHGQKVKAQSAARQAAASKPQAPKYPQSIQNILKNVKAEKGECKITTNEDGSYNLWITNTSFTKKHGCASYVLKYDAKGNRISQTNNYANGKVLEGAVGKDGKYTWTEKTPLKGNALKMFNTIQNDWHGQARVEYTKDGYNIIATGTDYEKKNNIAKYVYQYDRNGNLLSKTRTYNDGKEQKSVPKNGKDNWVTTKEAPEKGYFDRFTDWVSETWDDTKKAVSETWDDFASSKPATTSKPSTKPTTKKTTTKASTTPAKSKEMILQEKCQKYLLPSEWSYPNGIKEKLVEYREQGIGATVEKTRSGYRMLLDEDNINYQNIDVLSNNSLQTYTNAMNRQTSRLLPMNRDQKVFDFDKDGNIIKLTQDYPHKKVTTPYYNNKPVDTSAPAPLMRETTVYKKSVDYSGVHASRVGNDKTPAAISITLPERFKDNEQAQRFARALEQHKAELMQELGLTNAEYDQYVVDILGIAEQEYHFGDTFAENSRNNFITNDDGSWDFGQAWGQTQKRKYEKMVGRAVGATQEFFTGETYEIMGHKGIDGSENHSHGLTQINYWSVAIGKDPNAPETAAMRRQLAAHGIHSHEDYADNPEKAAIASILILRNKHMQVKNNTELQGYTAELNARTQADMEAELAKAKTQKEKDAIKAKYKDKFITENDWVVQSWNGFGNQLKRIRAHIDESSFRYNMDSPLSGARDSHDDKISDDMHYARFVRTYGRTFGIKSSTRAQNRAAALSADQQENYGELGVVHFMPGAYSNSRARFGDPNAAAATLTKALQGNNKIPQNIKNRLIQAVKNNEIGFGGNGFLTEKEANSITLADAKLLLKKLDTLKAQFEAQGIDPTRDKVKVRELAQNIDASFHSDYMQSRQVVANHGDIKNKASILPGFGSSDIVNERLVAHRQTIIQGHERAFRNSHAGGYQRNLHSYDGMRANGSQFGFGVERSLGINPYFEDGTMITPFEREYAETAEDVAAVDLGTSNQCLTGLKATWESSGVIESRSEVVYPKNVTQRMPAGMTVDNFVKKAGLPDVKSQQQYKQKLLARLNKDAKIDVNGNLIAGKTINTRANITIREGDTLDTILKRCGYTNPSNPQTAGEKAEAELYKTKRQQLEAQLRKDGMLDANGKPKQFKEYYHVGLKGVYERTFDVPEQEQNTFTFSARAKVQENDSYEKIASRLGYTGTDATKYVAGLKRECEASQVFNPDGTFKEGVNVVTHAAGETIEIAGHLYMYMDAHPEKFERLRYVDNGDGTVRELNASDAKRMPAAITEVFTPGEGFEDQCGHAAITNGNGQGYADEVDNLGWADFASGGRGNGKGEHGQVRYYRLAKGLRGR